MRYSDTRVLGKHPTLQLSEIGLCFCNSFDVLSVLSFIIELLLFIVSSIWFKLYNIPFSSSILTSSGTLHVIDAATNESVYNVIYESLESQIALLYILYRKNCLKFNTFAKPKQSI